MIASRKYCEGVLRFKQFYVQRRCGAGRVFAATPVLVEGLGSADSRGGRFPYAAR